MNDHDVPVKTDEGLAEMKKRSMGLTPRIRTALLLVDGFRTISELIPMLAAAGVQANALDILLQKGLIRLPAPKQADIGGEAVLSSEVSHTLPPQELPTVIRTLLQEESASNGKPGASEEALPVACKPTSMSETAAIPALVPAAAPAPAPERPQPAMKQVLEQEKLWPEPARPQKTLEEIPPATQTKPASAVPAEQDKVSVVPKPEPKVGAAVKTVARQENIVPPVSPSVPSAAVMSAPEARQVPSPSLLPTSSPAPVHKKAATDHDGSVGFMRARAHLASALDEHADIQGYILRQQLMGCANRAELVVLLGEVEKTLSAVLNDSKALEIMSVAKVVLED